VQQVASSYQYQAPGKDYHLGIYANRVKAATAYDSAARQRHGERGI
jgi:hypothetical protein